MNTYLDKLSLEYGTIIEDMQWNIGELAPLAKVYIPILLPMYSSDIQSITSLITEEGVNTIKGVHNRYTKTNYVDLTLPKYLYPYPILENGNRYRKIPVGTKVIIGFIGNSTKIEDIRIIGIDDFTLDGMYEPGI